MTDKRQEAYGVYESFERLQLKERAGIVSAAKELQERKRGKVVLPLKGIGNLSVCMVLTGEIQERLLSIENLYQQVTREHKAEDVILLDAYHSATIEGARTTVENVRRVFSKPETKDDKMVVNTVRGLHYAYENEITIKNIRVLWELVTQDVCENSQLAGTLFRDGMVYVGDMTRVIHTPAKPDEIADMMEGLFEVSRTFDCDIWLKAAIIHFYFVYTHPFCDGNGRLARILTHSFLLHTGKDKIKYLPLSRTINGNLSGYYTTLKEAETVYSNGKKWIDITPFLDYLLTMFEECMLTSLKEDQSLTQNARTLLLKMQKRGKGAEITIQKAAGILKMSQSTAGRALNQLTEAGYLLKKREEDRISIS